MKKNTKKGFTIVELVIVIAVIAILAAVMIPTFSGIVDKANNSAIIQETRAALTVLLVEENGQLDASAKYYFIHATDKSITYFQYINGEVTEIMPTSVDGLTNGELEPSAKDIVWCGSNDILVKAKIKTTNLTDANKNKIVLSDLKNVVIVKDVNEATATGG